MISVEGPTQAVPRIVIDARTVASVPHGMGRYVLGMASALSSALASAPVPYEPVFLVQQSLASSPEGLPPELRGFRTVSCRSRLFSPWEWIEVPALLRREGAALFHSPTFCAFPWLPCPYLLTIHDLNHLRFGSLFHRLYYQVLLKRFALQASALLTVSEFSRRELADWLGQGEEKIRIAFNVLDSGIHSSAPETEVLSRLEVQRGRYFFCMANTKAHKNIPTLLQAFSRARKEGLPQDFQLVVVLERCPSESPPAGVRFVTGITDGEVRALIESATAVVSPSLYEGFGLFPAEAATLGAALIVSDIAPHREGLRDLHHSEVQWVPAEDREGWAVAMRRAAGGPVAPSSVSQSAVLDRYSAVRLGSLLDGLYRDMLRLQKS